MKKIEEGNVVKKINLAFFDYFNRFLSNRCVFDFFVFLNKVFKTVFLLWFYC